jgi:ribosomal protein S18 acetylase RimI-like enzyme
MYIEVVSDVTEDLYQALQRLIPQLGAHKIPPTRDEIRELVESESSTLLAAHEIDEKGPILGILCLTVYRVPTGVRSIVEDVVVDGSARRRGIAEAMMQKAIALAREAGAEGISLTSNPQRQAANLLYQSIGFQLRQTNPYYFRLK